MRKHFLILMLMALLPLAGWAQTATFGEMSLGLYKYGSNTFPAPQVKDAEGAILTEGTHYTVVDHAFKDEDCTQVINEATPANLQAMKTDGTKYYRKVEGIGTYAGQTAVAWFTVTKAELTLTYQAGALDRIFGADPVAVVKNKFTVTGKKFAESDATLLKGSNPTYSTVNNNAGVDKAVTWTGGYTADNYTIKYADYTLTISEKNIGSTAPEEDRATITVEQPNIVYTGENIIGVYTIKDGTKTLTAGTPAVLYENAAEYNAAKGTTLDATAFAALTYAQKTKVAGTGDYWVAPVKNVDASAYKPTITFQNNYSGTMTPAVGFKVTPAPIVVSIDNIEKTYDGTNWKDHNFATAVLYTDVSEYNAAKGTSIDATAFTALSDAQKTKIAAANVNYSGIVGADLADAETIKATFTAPTSIMITTDAQDVKAGGYNLTISGAIGAGNYEIAEYIPGKLIINPAELELKAKDANKGIGAADPEFELDATANLVAGHTITGVTFTRAEGETAGTFDITPDYSAAKVYSGLNTPAQKDETGNYEFAVAAIKGQLTIGKSTIYVTIKDDKKFYGQDDPAEFDYVVTGLIEGDALGDFTITRGGAGTAAGENVGSYTLSAEVANPNTARYEKVVVANGIFTIKKAKLTFTIPAQNVVTGNKKNALKKDNITVAGIFKAADIANPGNLYTLDFNTVAPNNVLLGGTDNDEITAEDKTYAGGILLTLKTAAQANYEVIGDNKVVPADPTNPAISATGKLIVNAGTNFDLDFTCVDADYAAIKDHAGETQNVTIDFTNRNRKINATANVHTWAADKWNALVLPFDITVAELSSKLGHANGGAFNYVVVNTIKKDAPAGKFQFQLFTGTIPANTPFMVKTVGKITTTVAAEAATINVPIAFGAKTIVAPASETVEAKFDNGFKLVGKYKNFVIDKTMPMDEGASPVQGYYKFLYGDDDSQYRTFGPSSTNSWTIVPFDAYVDLSGDPEAHNVVFEFEEADGSTTSIKAIASEADNANVKMTGWYTINGTKLQAAPTQKGIYIFNGKKLVVK